MRLISHHCTACGADLTTEMGVWDRALRMRIVACPRCRRAAVRGSMLGGSAVSPRWRLARRLIGAAPWLVAAALVLGVGNWFLLGSCVELATWRPTTPEFGAMRQAASEFNRAQGSAGAWPFGWYAGWATVWLLASLTIGAWLGVVHPRRIILPVVTCWVITSEIVWIAVGIVFVVKWIAEMEASARPFAVDLRVRDLAQFAIVHAAAMVPMVFAAQCSRLIELRRQRRLWCRVLRRARARRDRRRSTIRDISIRPQPVMPTDNPLTGSAR